MFTIIMTFALMCPAPLIVDQTNGIWTDKDKENQKAATEHCVDFYPKSPCLVKFIKRAPLTYWAICGRSK
jgi:hypothetical protein